MKDGRRKTEDGRAASDGGVDLAIDRAVREMLDVEPPADLRERVVARLPASGSRLPASGFRLPASGFRLPAPSWITVASGSMTVASAFRRKLAVGAAAAALILIAVFVARHEPVAPQAPVVARGADVRLAPDVRPTQPAAPQVTIMSLPFGTARPERPEPRRRGADVAAAAADSVARTEIAPLNAIAPITVAPIESERIAPADIAVRQLNTINEIQIAPLTPPDRR